MPKQQKILIVGLFLSARNRHRILRTAADQLAELFEHNGVSTIKVSTVVNPVLRLVDTIGRILLHLADFRIAIVPLYGTPLSFLWTDITTLLLKMFGKKIVIVVHGGSIPQRMKDDAKPFLKALKRAAVVVCPSAYLVAVLKQYSIEARLVENVINSADYRLQKKEIFRPKILWMRTFEPVYNPEMAVRVAALLRRQYPYMQMVMAGYDQGSLAAVKQLAEQLQLEDVITFKGYIDNDEKNRLAIDYDFYICTNRIDNAPVSVVEMMALGLAVVTVDSGGLPYLVEHNKTGKVVGLDDDAAMAKSIAEVIDNPEAGRQLVANAKAFAEQFTEGPVLKKWQEILEQPGE